VASIMAHTSMDVIKNDLFIFLSLLLLQIYYFFHETTTKSCIFFIGKNAVVSCPIIPAES